MDMHQCHLLHICLYFLLSYLPSLDIIAVHIEMHLPPPLHWELLFLVQWEHGCEEQTVFRETTEQRDRLWPFLPCPCFVLITALPSCGSWRRSMSTDRLVSALSSTAPALVFAGICHPAYSCSKNIWVYVLNLLSVIGCPQML